MPSLDERTWLSDELWAQVRPPRARFRVTISVAVLVVAVGALVLSQIGFFHPRIGASYNEATVNGNRLIVVLSLYNSAQIPVRVTGFRAAQPGAADRQRPFQRRLSRLPLTQSGSRRHPRRTFHRARRSTRKQSPSCTSSTARSCVRRCASTSRHIRFSATRRAPQRSIVRPAGH